MKKRLRNFIALLDGKNLVDMTEKEKSILRTEILIQIGFFQHERLAHLIVTITFAMLTMISTMGCFAWPGISFLLLTGLFFILLVPYICHYYTLENGVQKLYQYYNEIINLD